MPPTITHIATPVANDPVASMIANALAPVAADLRDLSDKLIGFVPAETASAKAILHQVFGGGGKRIRPALYFMTCRLLGYKGPHYYPIAAVTEFVHTASLLHDDVVDHSTIRRGKPTANSIYGDESSVLVGDLVYSTASEMMAATGDMEIVRTFAEAIRLMSDGELLQLESLFNADLPESTYLRILECKTAILISASCKAAALLAKAPASQRDALSRFGYGVGMAFQLIDDALDYLGSEDLVGKATLADLPEGKTTMPVLLLMKKASPSEAQVVRDTLAQDPIDAEAAQRVAALVAHYDTAIATIERAQQYTQLAMDALYSFPASPERDALENLANKLLLRFH